MDAYDGAYRKGAQAFKDGLKERNCPYEDHRTYHGAVTFSRAFIKAWLTGYRAAKAGEDKQVWTSCDPHY